MLVFLRHDFRICYGIIFETNITKMKIILSKNTPSGSRRFKILKCSMLCFALCLISLQSYFLILPWSFASVRMFFNESKLAGFVSASFIFILISSYSVYFSFRFSHRVFRRIILKCKNMPRLSFYKFIISQNKSIRDFFKKELAIVWVFVAFSFTFYFLFG